MLPMKRLATIYHIKQMLLIFLFTFSGRGPSQCPRCLRRGSAAVRMLGLRVRIPPVVWMSVSRKCCVLSARGLCDGPITRPEESYLVRWVLTECDLETSTRRRPRPHKGLLCHGKKKSWVVVPTKLFIGRNWNKSPMVKCIRCDVVRYLFVHIHTEKLVTYVTMTRILLRVTDVQMHVVFCTLRRSLLPPPSRRIDYPVHAINTCTARCNANITLHW